MSIQASLLKLINAKSEKVIIENTERYIKSVEAIVKEWRKWVRRVLSTPSNRKRNMTPYPKMRTGALRNSLVTRRITVAKQTPIKLRKNQIILRIPIYWRKLKGNSIDDYGEHLNQSSAPFGGWKDRLRQELQKRIQTRL